MILTYIYHSGFMLEGVSVILIFDFWRDADNSIVERTLSTTHKRVYFLASHFPVSYTHLTLPTILRV